MTVKTFANKMPTKAYDIILRDVAGNYHSLSDVRDLIVRFGNCEVGSFEYKESNYNIPSIKVELK